MKISGQIIELSAREVGRHGHVIARRAFHGALLKPARSTACGLYMAVLDVLPRNNRTALPCGDVAIAKSHQNFIACSAYHGR